MVHTVYYLSESWQHRQMHIFDATMFADHAGHFETYSCVPNFLWVAIFAIIIYIPQVDTNVCYRLMPI